MAIMKIGRNRSPQGLVWPNVFTLYPRMGESGLALVLKQEGLRRSKERGKRKKMERKGNGNGVIRVMLRAGRRHKRDTERELMTRPRPGKRPSVGIRRCGYARYAVVDLNGDSGDLV